MSQYNKVLLAIDNAHTVPQRALNCGPGLGWMVLFDMEDDKERNKIVIYF